MGVKGEYEKPIGAGYPAVRHSIHVVRQGTIVDRYTIGGSKGGRGRKRNYKHISSPATFLIIGSQEDSDIIYPNPTVSRHHAVIQFMEASEYPILIDLDSRFGTLVNGKAVCPFDSVTLQAGDQIVVGDPKFSSRIFVYNGPELAEGSESEYSDTEPLTRIQRSCVPHVAMKSTAADIEKQTNTNRETVIGFAPRPIPSVPRAATTNPSDDESEIPVSFNTDMFDNAWFDESNSYLDRCKDVDDEKKKGVQTKVYTLDIILEEIAQTKLELEKLRQIQLPVQSEICPDESEDELDAYMRMNQIALNNESAAKHMNAIEMLEKKLADLEALHTIARR